MVRNFDEISQEFSRKDPQLFPKELHPFFLTLFERFEISYPLESLRKKGKSTKVKLGQRKSNFYNNYIFFSNGYFFRSNWKY